MWAGIRILGGPGYYTRGNYKTPMLIVAAITMGIKNTS